MAERGREEDEGVRERTREERALRCMRAREERVRGESRAGGQRSGAVAGRQAGRHETGMCTVMAGRQAGRRSIDDLRRRLGWQRHMP